MKIKTISYVESNINKAAIRKNVVPNFLCIAPKNLQCKFLISIASFACFYIKNV